MRGTCRQHMDIPRRLMEKGTCSLVPIFCLTSKQKLRITLSLLTMFEVEFIEIYFNREEETIHTQKRVAFT